jgi:ABC-type transport system involved in cytochrome c biogenesis permease subunit
MGSLDVPEVLILLGLITGFVWAVYNWTHPHLGSPK